jgi:hypothetical protein
MLFNLSMQTHFKNQQQAKWAIYSYSGYGPVFAADSNLWELGVNYPFNGDGKCKSFAN